MIKDYYMYLIDSPDIDISPNEQVIVISKGNLSLEINYVLVHHRVNLTIVDNRLKGVERVEKEHWITLSTAGVMAELMAIFPCVKAMDKTLASLLKANKKTVRYGDSQIDWGEGNFIRWRQGTQTIKIDGVEQVVVVRSDYFESLRNFVANNLLR